MKDQETPIQPEEIKYLPEVRFQLADTDSEADHFYGFIMESDSGRWIDTFIKVYPELVQRLQITKDKKEAMEVCEKFSQEQHALNKKEILASKELFEVEWKKIEKEFLSTLSEHLETDWPEEKNEIVGNITVMPIFPRYLDDYTFFVGYKDISRMIETSAHEIVHFLWFKKWKEVFPEIERYQYESPHLAWRLSEIIDPIILQCQPEIKELIKPKRWGYSSFEQIKIGDISMIDHFKKVYLNSVASGNDFSTTMKLLWEEAKKHEKEISNF